MTNLASSPTMRLALVESFADQQAITNREDLQLGRDVRPEPNGWREGTDQYEAQLARRFGGAA